MDRQTALDVFGLGELADLGLADTFDLGLLEERCRQLVARVHPVIGGSDYLTRQVVQAYLVLKKTNEVTSTNELDRRDYSATRRILGDVERMPRPDLERGITNDDDDPARATRDDSFGRIIYFKPRDEPSPSDGGVRRRTPAVPQRRESSKDTWPESWKRATRGFRPYPQ